MNPVYAEMNLDTIVKSGEPVPFDGVLVDEPSYRFYQNQLTALEIYQREAIEPEETSDRQDFYTGLVIGFLSATGIVLLSH